MKKQLVYIVALVILTAVPTLAQVAKENQVVALRDALKSMLQEHGATGLKKVTVNVDSDQAAAMLSKYAVEAGGSYTVYHGVNGDDRIGSVVIVNQDGKEGPLQVLVAVDAEGSVYDLGFTVFGEDKGKPALRWAYLQQYMGKTVSDQLIVGRDIDGVSGATMTSTSVAMAVRRALTVFAEFLDDSASTSP